jgi:hypothetical protein
VAKMTYAIYGSFPETSSCWETENPRVAECFSRRHRGLMAGTQQPGSFSDDVPSLWFFPLGCAAQTTYSS